MSSMAADGCVRAVFVPEERDATERAFTTSHGCLPGAAEAVPRLHSGRCAPAHARPPRPPARARPHPPAPSTLAPACSSSSPLLTHQCLPCMRAVSAQPEPLSHDQASLLAVHGDVAAVSNGRSVVLQQGARGGAQQCPGHPQEQPVHLVAFNAPGSLLAVVHEAAVCVSARTAPAQPPPAPGATAGAASQGQWEWASLGSVRSAGKVRALAWHPICPMIFAAATQVRGRRVRSQIPCSVLLQQCNARDMRPIMPRALLPTAGGAAARGLRPSTSRGARTH